MVKMFQAVLEDVTILKNSLEAITELIDEAVLQVKKNGLEILASDRSVVAVVDFFLSSKAFSEYDSSQRLDVGLNLLSLLQILKRAKSDDKVVLRIDNEKIQIILEGETERKFTLPIITIGTEDVPDISKLEFKANLELSSEQIVDAVNDANLVGDYLIFVADNEQFRMRSSSDTSSTETFIAKDRLKMELQEPARARYSLEYLKKMAKAAKLVDKVQLGLSNNYPLKMNFESPDVRLQFILAPRVED